VIALPGVPVSFSSIVVPVPRVVRFVGSVAAKLDPGHVDLARVVVAVTRVEVEHGSLLAPAHAVAVAATDVAIMGGACRSSNSRLAGIGRCWVECDADAGHHAIQHGAVLGAVNALRCAPTARFARPSGVDRACTQLIASPLRDGRTSQAQFLIEEWRRKMPRNSGLGRYCCSPWLSAAPVKASRIPPLSAPSPTAPSPGPSGPTLVAAQIEGRIIDADLEEPIPGARVTTVQVCYPGRYGSVDQPQEIEQFSMTSVQNVPSRGMSPQRRRNRFWPRGCTRIHAACDLSLATGGTS
jgi:hypothetical protein